jgi:hypothetical protein
VAPNEREKASSLMVLVGTPARYRFLHSSLAELIFHALAPVKGRTDAVQISELLATEVADYLTTDATKTSDQLLRVLKPHWVCSTIARAQGSRCDFWRGRIFSP